MSLELHHIIIIYFILVFLPFLLCSAYLDISQPISFRADLTPSSSWRRVLSHFKKTFCLKLCAYVAKFSILVWTYHSVLTIALSLYCANEASHKLKIAVDLNYYTKTSLRATEAYDAIQNAKYHASFHAWYINNSEETTDMHRRNLGATSDFVAIYHSSGGKWDNVLTSSSLVNICQAERMFLSSQICLGVDVASMVDVIFDENCEYLTTFEESLFLLGLAEYSMHVQDNVNSESMKSAVLLSFFSTSCSLQLEAVDTSIAGVERSVASTDICYVQNKLIIDAFILSGLHDAKLSVLAMLVSVLVLSISLGLRVLFSVLIMICTVLSLVISAGVLPMFGFSLFSAFNVLSIFVITGVGADSIIVFVRAWLTHIDDENARNQEELLVRSFTNDDESAHPPGRQEVASSDLRHEFPSIMYHSYGSVVAPLTFSVATTVLSFMTNLLSPIVVIAQLGAYMGIAMVANFVMLHLILIPAWISVMKVCPYHSECFPCLNLLKSSFVHFCRNFTTKKTTDTTVTTMVEMRSPTKLQYTINAKQSFFQGCTVLVSVIICILLCICAISSGLVTDFGLPMLFKEGANISDLMYVAKHFKADILTLSGEENSGANQPHHTTATVTPTEAPTASQAIAPTYHTTDSETPIFSPSLSPYFATTRPSSMPTIVPPVFAPTASPSTSESDLFDSNSATMFYTVYVCYGIDSKKDYIDADAFAKVNPNTFATYAANGLFLADTATLCDYLASNRKAMDVAMPDSECIYNQLMAMTSENISIYERIKLWLDEENSRAFQVGVEQAEEGPGSGNFGLESELRLSWLCQPIHCAANVTSFFDNPGHALTMMDRWDNALYDVSSDGAAQMNVVSLTGSDAWIFPMLSNQLVKSLTISLAISLFGSLTLLFITTLNLKLSLLIGAGMVVVIIVSLCLHIFFFSEVLDLIDVVVLLSFLGIIVDYPMHMAFHYERDLMLRRRRNNLSESNNDKHFHQKSFGNIRATLLAPALTTAFAAAPLLTADFTLISKAGEYIIIMCACTYLYIAFVMPTLLRLTGEFECFPCRPSWYYEPSRYCDTDIIVSQQLVHI